jgi:hypothetical protein
MTRLPAPLLMSPRAESLARRSKENGVSLFAIIPPMAVANSEHGDRRFVCHYVLATHPRLAAQCKKAAGGALGDHAQPQPVSGRHREDGCRPPRVNGRSRAETQSFNRGAVAPMLKGFTGKRQASSHSLPKKSRGVFSRCHNSLLADLMWINGTKARKPE